MTESASKWEYKWVNSISSRNFKHQLTLSLCYESTMFYTLDIAEGPEGIHHEEEPYTTPWWTHSISDKWIFAVAEHWDFSHLSLQSILQCSTHNL